MKRVMLSVCGVAASALVAVSAAHALDKDVVIDRNNSAVVDKHGNCVLTKWMDQSNLCLQKDDRTVYFAFDSSRLTAEGRTKLDALAMVLSKSGQPLRASIVGYADKLGAAGYNDALSKQRAATVAKYLAAKGLDTRVASVRALGETSSKSMCEDTLNRDEMIRCLWRDRRVEVEIEYR